MRKDWAARMTSLLSKDALLTCLEFPMYKDRKLPGPPWGLNGVHYDLLNEVVTVLCRMMKQPALRGKGRSRELYMCSRNGPTKLAREQTC